MSCKRKGLLSLLYFEHLIFLVITWKCSNDFFSNLAPRETSFLLYIFFFILEQRLDDFHILDRDTGKNVIIKTVKYLLSIYLLFTFHILYSFSNQWKQEMFRYSYHPFFVKLNSCSVLHRNVIRTGNKCFDWIWQAHLANQNMNIWDWIWKAEL